MEQIIQDLAMAMKIETGSSVLRNIYQKLQLLSILHKLGGPACVGVDAETFA